MFRGPTLPLPTCCVVCVQVASLPVMVPESDDDLIASSGLPPTRPWVSMETLRATHRSATQAFNTRQLNVLVGFAEGRSISIQSHVLGHQPVEWRCMTRRTVKGADGPWYLTFDLVAVMSTLILSSCSRSVPELLSYIVEDVRPPHTCPPHEASTLLVAPQSPSAFVS